LLLVTCAAGVESAYRFLHPFSFMGLIALAIVVDKMRERWWTEGRATLRGKRILHLLMNACHKDDR
jgi:hypothetical protein